MAYVRPCKTRLLLFYAIQLGHSLQGCATKTSYTGVLKGIDMVWPHHCMLHDSIQQDVERDVGYTFVALQHSDNQRPYHDCNQIISAAVRQDVHCLRQADKSLQDDKEFCVVGKRASKGVVAVSKS